jgi:hypothetical protein
MEARSGPIGELTLEIEHPDQLFAPRSPDVAAGLPPLPPGIDQLRDRLRSGRLRAPDTALIVLPRASIQPDLEHGIRTAVARYCELGIAQADNELAAIHREGVRSLGLGVLLLAIFLGLSEVALQSDLPTGLRSFFGDGLFVVAAWVGMWHPLETLIYTGPHRLDKKVLAAIQGMEILVRAAE